MAYSWPATVIPNVQDHWMDSQDGVQESPFGGGLQTNGSSVHKWNFQFNFPELTGAQALAAEVVLSQAGKADVIMPIYQKGLNTTPVMTPLVNTGSSGFTLKVKALDTSWVGLAGQFISVYSNSMYWLYRLAADSTAGSATRDLTLTSEIRYAHANNDPVQISVPYIQGYIANENRRSSLSVNQLSTLPSIVVRERK